MKYKLKKIECGRNGCKRERREGQRTCRQCHAEDMRKYRRIYVRREEVELCTRSK